RNSCGFRGKSKGDLSAADRTHSKPPGWRRFTVIWPFRSRKNSYGGEIFVFDLGLSRRPLARRCKQPGGCGVQRLRDARERLDGDVLLIALNLADVGAIKPSLVPKPLLRQARSLAAAPDVLRNNCPDSRLIRHIANGTVGRDYESTDYESRLLTPKRCGL